MASSASDGSQTLERGLRALRIMADSHHGVTASELAATLDVHRSVAYRLLGALVRQGFATKSAMNRYQVGPALISIAAGVRPELREIADPFLRQLANDANVTTCLLVRDGDDAVAISVVEPASPGPRISYRVGNRDSLQRGAGGIAIHAASTPDASDEERVLRARDSGFVISHEEIVDGVYAVAAPIVTADAQWPAAIKAISHRESVITEVTPLVITAAHEIACELETFG